MQHKKINILKNLVLFDNSIKAIQESLQTIDWDKSSYVTLTMENVKDTINKFISNQISEDDFIEWANLIECREDILFEPFYKHEIEEFIFHVANPELDGFEYINSLKKRTVNKNKPSTS